MYLENCTMQRTRKKEVGGRPAKAGNYTTISQGKNQGKIKLERA
jgi:hypothetical protein